MQTLAQYEAAYAERAAEILRAKARVLIAQTTEELRRCDQGRTVTVGTTTFYTPTHRAAIERELKCYYEWLAA